MTSQHSAKESFSLPEFEYRTEELQKKLRYSMANFASVRFKRAVQLRVSLDEAD